VHDAVHLSLVNEDGHTGGGQWIFKLADLDGGIDKLKSVCRDLRGDAEQVAAAKAYLLALVNDVAPVWTACDVAYSEFDAPADIHVTHVVSNHVLGLREVTE
jgi:hypothetical protein